MRVTHLILDWPPPQEKKKTLTACQLPQFLCRIIVQSSELKKVSHPDRWWCCRDQPCLDTSAGTGKLCILGHLGLVFIWSCFVSCLLFLLFYVSLRNLCSGTCRKIPMFKSCKYLKQFLSGSKKRYSSIRTLVHIKIFQICQKTVIALTPE